MRNYEHPYRIVMAVTNDLLTDQRVARSCAALNEAGFAVRLVGRNWPRNDKPARGYRVEKMRLLFKRKSFFYAEYNFRLFLKLMFCRFDMVYANDSDTLMGAYWGAKLRGKKLFFDAHEMFAEVPELVDRPKVKRFWERLERRYIPRVDGAVTVCQSIADEYERRHGVKMGVVRNVPERSVCEGEGDVERGLLLYQGAVNKGRGLDWMIHALEYLPECRLVVAGVGDELEKMKSLAAAKPWHERIVFLDRVLPAELRNLTRRAELGLCLLQNCGLNYYYSLPNRIGDFVSAEVPVLAIDFPEIRNVVSRYGVGALVGEQDASDARRLAAAVEQTLSDWRSMSSAERKGRFEKAQSDLCWDNDKEHLLKAVRAAKGEN